MRKLLLLLVLLSGCSKGGSGGSDPAPATVAPREVIYPSVLESSFATDKPIGKAGSLITLTVTTRDQHHQNYALPELWSLSVQVNCDTCQTDFSPRVTARSVVGNQSQFSFVTAEDANYTIQALFSPTVKYQKFDEDFPPQFDQSVFYGDAMTLPAFNVCDLGPDPLFHGLKGQMLINSVDRLAICAPEDLRTVALDSWFLDKDLYLARSLDFSSYYSSGQAEFQIGTETCAAPLACGPFVGSFSGNGFKISNFKQTNQADFGLFGLIRGGVIEDLVVDHATFSGARGAALAAKTTERGLLQNLSVVNSTITGTELAAGLIGTMSDSTITASDVSATISAQNIAGGLVGSSIVAPFGFGNSLFTSSSSSTIHIVASATSGGSFAGGLLGLSTDDTLISDCYSRSNIASLNVAGGLVGHFKGSIRSSYATGQISGVNKAGGLIGETENLSAFTNHVENSFVDAEVIGTQSGIIAGDCRYLIVTNFSGSGTAGDPNECGATLSYSSSGIIRGSQSTITDLMIQLRPIVNLWRTTVWQIKNNLFPTIF